ncbi:MAG TPA: hypothetical protein VEA69_00365 [Tepidisphaeraceae bacterium]|nr:hypothetical protein [Tepidisphaeraceae bacterium]
MDPLHSFNINPTPPSTTDDAAERRRDERKAQDVAAANRFQSTLKNSRDGGAPAAKLAAKAQQQQQQQQTTTKGNTKTGANVPQEALSPALMKLKANAGAEAGAAASAKSVASEGAAEGLAEAKGEQAGATGAAASGASADVPMHTRMARGGAAGGGALNAALMSAMSQWNASTTGPDLNAGTEAARLQDRVVSTGGRGIGVDKPDDKVGTAGEVDPSEAGAAAAATGPAPSLAPQAQHAAAPQQAGPATTIPTALLQQVVEFATVAKNADGFMEFRMGLSKDALGGMRVRVTAYGNRRIGLKVQNGSGGERSVGEDEVSSLIEALRARNVEVVDVEVE